MFIIENLENTENYKKENKNKPSNILTFYLIFVDYVFYHVNL